MGGEGEERDGARVFLRVEVCVEMVWCSSGWRCVLRCSGVPQGGGVC